MQYGSIPTNVVYIHSNLETINGLEVYPAFISDAKNKKTIETGTKWAEGPHWKENKSEVIKFERPNDPIFSVRILSLEKRGRGGRAYKVVINLGVTNKLFYVDLREDTLLDVIQEVGIQNKGYLKGSFIWARVDSEMKLIRVGSKLHDEMIKSTGLAKQKISKSKLEVGGVYSNKHYTGVYCGNFTTISCEIENKWVPNPNNKYQQINNIKRTFKLLENVQLWADCYFYKDGKSYQAFKTEVFPFASCELVSDFNFLIDNQKFYCFEFVKNKIIREKLNQLTVTKPTHDSLKIVSQNLINDLTKPDDLWANRCEIINLTPVGSELVLHSEFQKYPELVSIVDNYNAKLIKKL